MSYVPRRLLRQRLKSGKTRIGARASRPSVSQLLQMLTLQDTGQLFNCHLNHMVESLLPLQRNLYHEKKRKFSHTLQNASIATLMNTVVKGIKRSLGAKGTTWFYFRCSHHRMVTHVPSLLQNISATRSCLHNSWNQNKSFGFQTDSSWEWSRSSALVQHAFIKRTGTLHWLHEIFNIPSCYQDHQNNISHSVQKHKQKHKITSASLHHPQLKYADDTKSQNSFSYIDFKGWAQHPL